MDSASKGVEITYLFTIFLIGEFFVSVLKKLRAPLMLSLFFIGD